jgi:hypothetical protein
MTCLTMKSLIVGFVRQRPPQPAHLGLALEQRRCFFPQGVVRDGSVEVDVVAGSLLER